MSPRSERPLIGLSTYREQARWGVWDTRADLLPAVYAQAIEAVGGVPVLLPPVGTTDAAAKVVSRLDGLVISGGADVTPARYGEPAHARTARWREDRDDWEVALLDAAEAAGLPTLGVCRGMQVMAVRAGGRLEQHLPDRVGHEDHSPGGDEFGVTVVDVLPGSRLAALVGERLSVHCHHHQAVLEHPGFAAVAHAPDGTAEAIEAPDGRFCVGVQWHPEMAHDAGLFHALVAAAAAYRAPAGG
jgi:putative glutamine amidotransferase